MEDCKPLSVLIYVGTKISIEECPATPKEMDDMASISYASVVDSLMSVMLYTRPDNAQVVRLLIPFMVDVGHEHWVVVKRVFRFLRGYEYSIHYHNDV
jgi:hypothetical protein